MTIQLSFNFDLLWNEPQIPPRDCWETPPEILEIVRSAFANKAIFTDPCTTKDNPTNALRFFTPKENGIMQHWKTNAFINPPYSDPSPWIEAANSQIICGSIEEAIALVPTACLGSKRTGKFAKLATAICLWEGRIHFVHPQTGRPAKQTSFTSAFLYWGKSHSQFEKAFSKHGIVAVLALSQLSNYLEEDYSKRNDKSIDD
ncbi:MAG: DNA N-6-adenine-methyltransferase [Cyanobacteriota bacterium]|nr:DNA N-6-adenine-methyltransferase [Cyanobacteriota bacterium]